MHDSSLVVDIVHETHATQAIFFHGGKETEYPCAGVPASEAKELGTYGLVDDL